jgi:UDP-glucuronate decarboxylase
LSGSTSKLEFLPLPTDDPRQRQPDISLAKKLLGWQPRVSVEDGLKETISYFKRLIAA